MVSFPFDESSLRRIVEEAFRPFGDKLALRPKDFIIASSSGGSALKAPVYDERRSFLMDKDTLDELLRFVDYVKRLEESGKLKLEELSKEDVKYLKGGSFRGVSLWMFVFSVYFCGSPNFSVRGPRLWNGEGEVEIIGAFASNKIEQAIYYANDYYIHRDKKYEYHNNLFHFVLRDNAYKEFDIPGIMLFPFIIAYKEDKLYPPVNPEVVSDWKAIGGIVPGEAHVDESTIKELCNILGVTEKKLKEMFPILYSSLRKDSYTSLYKDR